MNMNSARRLAPVKRGMVDKKVWENGDNDSMRDWTLSRGKIKGVSVVRWTGKGDGVKKKKLERMRDRQQENVLQTHEVVEELKAS